MSFYDWFGHQIDIILLFVQTSSHVQISDVSFRNIKGTSVSIVAVSLVCSDSVPCQNVELENIDLKFYKKGKKTNAVCMNVNGSSSGVENPPSCL
ncbi:hypothetical protein QJS04_geneDACA009123 [Acorus gramineus]|uniref:Uncharacterized protein n=1 Tax=Acorus gramineus TaxID=55184 RepID=A0AAV9AU26_ACOGR|nr:hypothetical protein QJS04_geneDACA009123 [Acorus gramineus]